MTALSYRYRRFEVRFREPSADPAPLPGTCDRELFEAQEGSDLNNAAVVHDDAVEVGNQQRRFVRQPVKILLVPRRRLIE